MPCYETYRNFRLLYYISNYSFKSKYDYPPYTVIGGSPAKEIAHGVYRDVNDDIIDFPDCRNL